MFWGWYKTKFLGFWFLGCFGFLVYCVGLDCGFVCFLLFVICDFGVFFFCFVFRCVGLVYRVVGFGDNCVCTVLKWFWVWIGCWIDVCFGWFAFN